MTTQHDRHTEQEPGDLGRALALLVAWGREAPDDDPPHHLTKSNQDHTGENETKKEKN